MLQHIEDQYGIDIYHTDEYLKPWVRKDAEGRPIGRIEEGDALIFFNFRSDRPRQILSAFLDKFFNIFRRKKLDLHVTTMTNFKPGLVPDENIAFRLPPVKNSLGEILAKAGKRQLRAAETEKFPHVTFFFNGRNEEPFTGEDRVLAPSPKVSTYDLKPEMSADEVTDNVIKRWGETDYDFTLVNYANPDMVGHTGNFDAAKKAVETVDQNLKRLVAAAQEKGLNIIVTADHGNAEQMKTSKGPHTKHTTNNVPFVFIPSKNSINQRENLTLKKGGALGNVAPTLLEVMGITKPKEMSSESLLEGWQEDPNQKTLLVVLDGWGHQP